MLFHGTTLPCLQALQCRLAKLCCCTDSAMCFLHQSAGKLISIDIAAELCTQVQDA